MASSSSSGPIIDPEEKFVTGSIGLSVKLSSVMFSLMHIRWSGTIVGQKADKTIVLTVAHMLTGIGWMSKQEIESVMKAQFFDDRGKEKHNCTIVFLDPESDIALIVVNKRTTLAHKLSFAPPDDCKLKELEFLGCRGDEWRIATGRVCFPRVLNDPKQPELRDYTTKMVYFEHRLDLGGIGYMGAALVNEKGDIVGMQTAQSFDGSQIKYAIHVEYMHDIFRKKLKVAGPTIKSLEKALEDLI